MNRPSFLFTAGAFALPAHSRDAALKAPLRMETDPTSVGGSGGATGTA